jgi:hypothetical protein
MLVKNEYDMSRVSFIWHVIGFHGPEFTLQAERFFEFIRRAERTFILIDSLFHIGVLFGCPGACSGRSNGFQVFLEVIIHRVFPSVLWLFSCIFNALSVLFLTN